MLNIGVIFFSKLNLNNHRKQDPIRNFDIRATNLHFYR